MKKKQSISLISFGLVVFVSFALVKLLVSPVKTPVLRNSFDAESLSKGIVFKAKDEKHVISVWIDVQCSHCQAMIDNVDRYLSVGFTMVFHPLPIKLGSRDVMLNIWCQPEPEDSLLRVKAELSSGSTINSISLNDTSRECRGMVNNNIDSFQKLGIRATPAIILPNYSVVYGAIPPEKLIEMLGGEK